MCLMVNYQIVQEQKRWLERNATGGDAMARCLSVFVETALVPPSFAASARPQVLG